MQSYFNQCLMVKIESGWFGFQSAICFNPIPNKYHCHAFPTPTMTTAHFKGLILQLALIREEADVKAWQRLDSADSFIRLLPSTQPTDAITHCSDLRSPRTWTMTAWHRSPFCCQSSHHTSHFLQPRAWERLHCASYEILKGQLTELWKTSQNTYTRHKCP